MHMNNQNSLVVTARACGNGKRNVQKCNASEINEGTSIRRNSRLLDEWSGKNNDTRSHYEHLFSEMSRLLRSMSCTTMMVDIHLHTKNRSLEGWMLSSRNRVVIRGKWDSDRYVFSCSHARFKSFQINFTSTTPQQAKKKKNNNQFL